MRPAHLAEYLSYAIQHHYPVLITGAPGIGKSDIVEQACKKTGVALILSHPVTSDPTDFKGLPFPRSNGKGADFLPFGDLEQLINAKEETVFFFDDLGQAPTSVQAACMQLILARRINGHKISDKVTFLAATNRKQDKAGVTGIIEPLKRRFIIQELNVNWKDWIKWAGANGMPTELMAFVAFKQEEVLFSDKATTDITNSPCPRMVAMVGRQQVTNCPEDLFEDAVKGAVGEVFATQYMAFLKLFKNLPSVDSVMLNPAGAKIPPTTDSQFAFIVSLAKRMTDTTIAPICEYLNRLKPELNVCCMKMAISRDANLQKTKAFIDWGAGKSDDLL